MREHEDVEPAYIPAVDDMVRDIARPAYGVVMGRHGDTISLRTLRGELTWDTDADSIRPVPQLEVLSARAVTHV